MEAAKRFLAHAWRDAKSWRSFYFGPLTLHLRFARSTSLFSNRARRIVMREITPDAQPTVPATKPAEVAPNRKQVETALVIGMGSDIGPAIARKLTSHDARVAVVSRNETKLQRISSECADAGRPVHAYSADVTNERAVRDLVRKVGSDVGIPKLVIYGVQGWNPGLLLETEVAAFEEAWRSSCLGAFIVARECARAMVAVGGGTVVFLGATSGTVGRAGYLNLAVGKFGLRALAQVMAKELGPQGVHVIHVVIDADVRQHTDMDGTPRTDPDDLAELIWSLHKQPRSAWTSELDVRPFDEAYWEHC